MGTVYQERVIRDLSNLMGGDWRISDDGTQLLSLARDIQVSVRTGTIRVGFPDPFNPDTETAITFDSYTYGTVCALLSQVELLVRVASAARNPEVD